jgi:hypothetical protein
MRESQAVQRKYVLSVDPAHENLSQQEVIKMSDKKPGGKNACLKVNM